MIKLSIPWDALKDYVLFGIALWGAVLSTINWVQNSRRNKRTLKVTHGYKYLTWNGGLLGPGYLEIKATNGGNRPVTIATLTLETSDGKWFGNDINTTNMEDTVLPAPLADGEVAVAYFLLERIRKNLHRPGIGSKVSVIPFAVDTLGKTYKGKPVEIDLTAKD